MFFTNPRGICRYVSKTYPRGAVTVSYTHLANFQTPYNNQVYELKALNGKLLSFGKAAGDNSFYVPVDVYKRQPGLRPSGV